MQPLTPRHRAHEIKGMHMDNAADRDIHVEPGFLLYKVILR